MPSAPRSAGTLTPGSLGRVRPAFDLSPADLAALEDLPEPWRSMPRDARVGAVLAQRYSLPPALRAPALPHAAERGETAPVKVRLPRTILAALDAERGTVSRGAFLRAVLDTYRKVSLGA